MNLVSEQRVACDKLFFNALNQRNSWFMWDEYIYFEKTYHVVSLCPRCGTISILSALCTVFMSFCYFVMKYPKIYPDNVLPEIFDIIIKTKGNREDLIPVVLITCLAFNTGKIITYLPDLRNGRYPDPYDILELQNL